MRTTRSGASLVVAAILTIALTARVATQAAQPAAPQTPAGGTAAAPAGRADVGRTVFTKNGCFQCHANEAQGGVTGPRLGPSPISLARLTAYVRHPFGEMPPYTAKVLPDRDLADLYAFLQSLPQPPPVSSIPLLAP